MQSLVPSIVAGAASALLHILGSAFGLGLLFLFLPTLPILWLGLTGRRRESLYAALAATMMLVPFVGPSSAFTLYALVLALPAYFFSLQAIRRMTTPTQPIWYPLTVIFSQMMTGFSVVLLVVVLVFYRHEGGLPGLLTPHVIKTIEIVLHDADEATRASFESMAPSLAFFVFAFAAWMWGLCLYLHGWVVTRELVRQKRALRPDMSIMIATPPHQALFFLLIASLAALIGSPSLAFWGMASILVLLFPYFLLGMALAHLRLRHHEYRSILLFSLYLLLALFLWPVLGVAIYGLMYHLRLLNNHLSSGGNSSRS